MQLRLSAKNKYSALQMFDDDDDDEEKQEQNSENCFGCIYSDIPRC